MGDVKKDKDIVHRKLDGELNKHETKVFHKKIKTDPHIKTEYESLKRVTDTSQKVVKPIPPPPDFRERVIKDLKADDQND
jgi:hypothetical protein